MRVKIGASSSNGGDGVRGSRIVVMALILIPTWLEGGLSVYVCNVVAEQRHAILWAATLIQVASGGNTR